MKNSLWTIAAAALLLAGCSKEEITENISEGTSSVATPVNGNARFGNQDNLPDVSLNTHNGKVSVKLKGKDSPPSLNVLVAGEEAENEGALNRLGNSKNYTTANNFIDGQSMYFSLVDVTLTSPHFIDDWQGETAYLSLFVYPNGRPVVQAPKAIFRRWHVQETITGEWDETITEELRITVADDPAQAVAQVKLVPEPIYGNPDDPTDVFIPETVFFEKTHENQNLGLSRWIGRQIVREVSRQRASLLMRSEPGTYAVDFLDEEDSRAIVAKYSIEEDEDGTITTTLSDEPEILGGQAVSTTFGETWKLEVAVADLGDWAQTANFALEGVESPDGEEVKLSMELTRVEGNLRVFSYSGVILNLSPDDGELIGTMFLNGQGYEGKERLVVKALLQDTPD